ncbi:glycerol 3-phosphate dehydrogenase (NAD(P)+) [Archaeoglobus sulfaticallidus PM70-1]|uniref:Glycerol 3-phosphate dehydrogenase (NAD(P)+) n=1 Tax=Archaeoglobus sulfaticallidus PM70-1 TaxID=387631 RepID=N0BLJ9_9EURY|nr:NAD(P)-binding domain-containing protein [Archaeoglobus sulfaticallidus]AGK61416.1 glycerol 3-phosphate dehydrogenase (NAD(P)+) [Archaeoglobus sulfaticallidus PM70-1]
MNVTILGAGAMGSALTVPLTDSGNNVRLWGTEYDVEILKKVERGEKHPRIDVRLEGVKIFYPEDIEKAVRDADIILLAVSTDGVLPIFRKIADHIENEILVTIAKGLIEIDGKILTVPEAIWTVKDIKNRTVAITGPSIAREVAKRMPTKVVFSSVGDAAEKVKDAFETEYYSIEVSRDIWGTEITSALKNVYSIAIAWVRGHEKLYGVEMSNAKGVITTRAINEIAKLLELTGGNRDTVFGLSGFGDLIATFRGGRNGMLGEMLGRGLNVREAFDELQRRGVGVVEGYQTAEKAYRLMKDLEKKGKTDIEEFPLLKSIYDVLYRDKKVAEVLYDLVVK